MVISDGFHPPAVCSIHTLSPLLVHGLVYCALPLFIHPVISIYQHSTNKQDSFSPIVYVVTPLLLVELVTVIHPLPVMFASSCVM